MEPIRVFFWFYVISFASYSLCLPEDVCCHCILVCNMHVNAVLLIKYGQKYFKFMHQFFLIINFNHFDSLKLNFLEWGDWQGYGLDLLMTEILNFLLCLVLPEWRDSGCKKLGISFTFKLLIVSNQLKLQDVFNLSVSDNVV